MSETPTRAFGRGRLKAKGWKMKKVIVSDDEVMTLEEAAVKLHERLGWKSHTTDAKEGIIQFEIEDGRKFNLHTSGFAYEVIDGKESEESDDEQEVTFYDALKLINCIFAEDEEGNTVIINT